jgi:hypothetical protein
VSNLLEDHTAAFLALLTGAGLTAYDGEVPDGAANQYVLVYSYFETPDGLVAPDAVSLAGASVELSPRMYTHSVGVTAQSARATAARVRAAVLDQVLAVSGRTCSAVRWREGQPPRRNEEVPGDPRHDQVDVYGWRSLPV